MSTLSASALGLATMSDAELDALAGIPAFATVVLDFRTARARLDAVESMIEADAFVINGKTYTEVGVNMLAKLDLFISAEYADVRNARGKRVLNADTYQGVNVNAAKAVSDAWDMLRTLKAYYATKGVEYLLTREAIAERIDASL